MTPNLTTTYMVAAYLSLGIFQPLVVALFGVKYKVLGFVLSLTLFVVGCARYWKYATVIPARLMLYVGVLILFFFIQSFVRLDLWSFKTYASIPLLLMMVVVSNLTANFILKADRTKIFYAIKVIVFILCIVFIANKVFDLKFLGYGHQYALVPFSEPSHYALFAGPVFLVYYLLTESRHLKIFFMIVTVAISVAAPSATMIFYAVLMLLIDLRARFTIILYGLILAILLTWLVLSNQYFYDRIMLNIGGESPNLSAAVYMQGVDDAIQALFETNYLGLGFQMLGTQPASSYYSEIIALATNGGELNREDGSFLAAKLIAEFGILGIWLVGLIFFRCMNSLLFLRNQTRFGAEREIKEILAHGLIFSFLVELFVRGYGYFSPGVFAYITFTICLSKIKMKRIRRTMKFAL